MLFIVAHGNPADGFTHYGPFPDHDAAILWAESEATEVTRDESWWVISLHAPDEESK